MRIISGKFRGKKIKYINSLITRPLRDIVRENIFNLLAHGKKININIEKSNVLDLYAGVGSFGIECISRNANKVVFVERNQIAFSILKENIASLKLKENIINQVTNKVRWKDTMEYALDKKINTVLECGSGKVLSGLFKRFSQQFNVHNIESVEDLKELEI